MNNIINIILDIIMVLCGFLFNMGTFIQCGVTPIASFCITFILQIVMYYGIRSINEGI
jgi:hypothetical protein